MVSKFEIASRCLTRRLFVPLLLVGIVALAACAKDETLSPPTSIPTLISTPAPDSTPTLAPSPTSAEQEGDIVATSVPSGPSGVVGTGEVSQELVLPREKMFLRGSKLDIEKDNNKAAKVISLVISPAKRCMKLKCRWKN